jgi:hypothetical protein
VELALPRAAAFENLAIGRDAFILRVIDAKIFGEVGVEPGADFVAEGFLLGSVFEVQSTDLFAFQQESRTLT